MKKTALSAIAIAALSLFSCGIVDPGSKNESPYVISSADPGTASAMGYDILLGRKYQLSFTSTPVITVKKVDSTFECSGSKCKWHTTVFYDTTVNLTSSYSVFDTVRCYRTVHFSFFDAENDSCEAKIELVTDDGTRLEPDTVWGDVFSRPGSDKIISARFHCTVKQFTSTSSFNPAPGVSSRIRMTLTQIDDRTIQSSKSYDYSSSGVIDSVVSDETYFKTLEGTWKMALEGARSYSALSIDAKPATRNVEFTIKNNSMSPFVDDTLQADCAVHSRTEWSAKVDNARNSWLYMTISLPYTTITLVGTDTLVNYQPFYGGKGGYAMAVFVRKKP